MLTYATDVATGWAHWVARVDELDKPERLGSEDGLWQWPVPSPDSTRIAFFYPSSPIRLGIAAADGKGGHPLADLDNVPSISWSPDGTAIACSTDSRVGVVILGRKGE